MNDGKADQGNEMMLADGETAHRLAYGPTAASLAAVKPHIPLVKAVINRLGGWLPPDVPPGTLVGNGILALMEAAQSCAPESARFPEVAQRYIWRAVAGALSQSRCFTEGCREALECLGKACAELIERSTPVDEAALADIVATSTEQVRDYLTRIGTLIAVHPGIMLQAGGEGSDDSGALGEYWQEWLTEAIGLLPQAAQLVVALYYFEDLSFPEIAAVLEQPLAQVQQLFGRAALLLQAHLARKVAGGESTLVPKAA